MDIIQVVVLALVQGISEFLPISSSAHLVLVPKLFSWVDQGLAFDVAVHIGTLVAIIIYFKDRIFRLLSDFFVSIIKHKSIGESSLVWAVCFATIPAGLFGLAFNDIIEKYARSGVMIAVMTIIFGIVLYVADKNVGTKSEYDITIKLALLIGLAQALALIPGVSRSGVTISAALLLGFSRVASANFSFLMSIPVILLAGGLESLKLIKDETTHIYSWSDLGLAFVLSAVSAYICVRLFMVFISKVSMLPFVIYRILLGMFLLGIFL
ncbi:undecaprenyl-diphosphate phosphatase [Campylobacter sp. faydin G-105]|uniref:undecaprenyl-diphosphate phosphatase n=1 Tax=Campylobacter anatolicus TaxID=2829105 RepID=UPI001B90BBAC|nr:undecaprenyl-diphosphate phosphatase [Campylobacter anatolicus]MBR8461345.1 undecaprenyl-diphosphate phosphatase [Campylobacter anatolicus]